MNSILNGYHIIMSLSRNLAKLSELLNRRTPDVV